MIKKHTWVEVGEDNVSGRRVNLRETCNSVFYLKVLKYTAYSKILFRKPISKYSVFKVFGRIEYIFYQININFNNLIH